MLSESSILGNLVELFGSFKNNIHLAMSDVAQKRDLTDAKTITDFAELVQSLERLRLLLWAAKMLSALRCPRSSTAPRL